MSDHQESRRCYVCMECTMNIQADGVEYGRAKERVAIVAWLVDAKRGDLSGRYLASFIERGEHLRGDDE